MGPFPADAHVHVAPPHDARRGRMASGRRSYRALLRTRARTASSDGGMGLSNLAFLHGRYYGAGIRNRDGGRI